jgi:uncharacterized protein (UPF0276 family)
MYGRAVELCGPTNTLLEWDAHIPSFDEVHGEALKARRFIERVKGRRGKRGTHAAA